MKRCKHFPVSGAARQTEQPRVFSFLPPRPISGRISRVFVKHHHARNLCSYVCLDTCEFCLYLVRVMSCYVLFVCNHCSCPTFFKRSFACHPLLQVFHEAQSEMVLAHNPATKQEPLHFFSSHLNCASTIL